MIKMVLTAVALVFVIEGILPFLSPPLWKQFMLRLSMQPDKTIRIMGLTSLLLGTVLMYLVHSGLLF